MRTRSKDQIVELSTKRHTDGAYSARPEYSALVCREYTLLLPEEPAGDPAAAWPQWSVGSPEGTMGIGGIDRRETRTMERNGQCTLLACGQPEDEDEEQGPTHLIGAPTNGSRRGGGFHPAARFPRAARRWRGTPLTDSSPLACSQGVEEGGGTPHTAARAPHVQPGDRGGYPNQAAGYPIVQTGDGV